MYSIEEIAVSAAPRARAALLVSRQRKSRMPCRCRSLDSRIVLLRPRGRPGARPGSCPPPGGQGGTGRGERSRCRNGWHVAVIAPADGVVGEITSAGGRALANYSDISTVDGARELLEFTLGSLGRVDIVINNAGILRDANVPELDPADWSRVIDVNLSGPFWSPGKHGRPW